MIKIEEGVKGLIFDLDGTIADTMPIHYIAWRNTAARYGIDFSEKLFYDLAGVTLYAIAKKLNETFGKNIDPIEMGDAKEAEYEESLWKAKPITPVVEVIEHYHGKMPMAVGTGGNSRLARKTLEVMGVSQYIDIIVASDNIENPKPHPETFLRCAELMGVNPENCQVFEDGALGIQAAQTAGMKVVDVRTAFDNKSLR
jgi:haloacid dehalogenase superfamily, subfamily IA, variant 3 with third motif having DD or ED/beta-phosphoglucomutase family hydrolase